MIKSVLKKVFGTRNDRVIKSLESLLATVNKFEAELKTLSDKDLGDKTIKFKERLNQGESLLSIEAESYAVVREASRRVLGMRHFDVQIIGGAVLHRGMIAEMRTGEGKTLVATLPTYLNALTGKGVHVVTVNDYLARRDSEWMGKIFRYLGLSVGCVVHSMSTEARRDAYNSDITYGQNNEFGFDYLRDNMKFDSAEMVQRGHNFAVVDEVDSILIDEARTPLIISGPAEDATEKYHEVNKIIHNLKVGVDYEVDLKSKNPTLTESGISHVEKLLGIENLYDPTNADSVHHVNQALKAHVVFSRDVDYVVEKGQIVIIDEFTGRKMPGRRWSDGLHQAIEAKEGVKIANENQTLASVTFQNYFRLYSKLAGMTGTADTEAAEFKKIYGLDVTIIPTNRSMIRKDYTDKVYRSRREKYAAVIADIEERHKTGQPILVGTISIEQSEIFSKMLKDKGVTHNVLNAKYHEREAEIVAQAGRFGAVTIATNMAGRGTDILLGGNPQFLALSEIGSKSIEDPGYQDAFDKWSKICADEREKVVAAGGVHILGTERHESRRIDNQLRGRSGRQGDPGSSQFYISLEDDLMMRFGGEKLQAIMNRLNLEEGVSLEGSMISRSIESAQRRVEGHHFDVRKHLLEYDNVMNKQRQAVYSMRNRILEGGDVREEVLDMVDDLLEQSIMAVCDEKLKPSEWNLNELSERYTFLFNATSPVLAENNLNSQVIFDVYRAAAKEVYKTKVATEELRLAEFRQLGERENDPIILQISKRENAPTEFKTIEEDIYLETLDHFWKLHLQEMDHLREGIGLMGYGQKNPLHEYQREGFFMFQRMLAQIKEFVVRRLYYYQVPDVESFLKAMEVERQRQEALEKRMKLIHASDSSSAESESHKVEQNREKLEAARKARRQIKK